MSFWTHIFYFCNTGGNIDITSRIFLRFTSFSSCDFPQVCKVRLLLINMFFLTIIEKFGIFALNMAFWRFFLYSVALWRCRREKIFRHKFFFFIEKRNSRKYPKKCHLGPPLATTVFSYI